MPPRKARKAAGQVKVEPQVEPRELGVVVREEPGEPSVVKTEKPRQLGVVKTEASAPQRGGEVGWPWLTDLPYSATDPELVLVAMYPGAPVPDHVRQFVASIICRTGMPDYVVEAAAWVILWSQRAAAAKDLGIKSMTRVLYSLSMGSCMSYVVARQLEPYHIGPSFSVEERRNVQAAAKAILHQVETYRNQYGRKFCVPAVEPPDTDPYWAMVVSICSTWATAIHVMQRDSANLPTDQFMEVRGHPVHMMVYRMSSVGGAYSQRYYAVTARQMDQPCPYIADVLEVLQCAQYVPQEGRAQLVERALGDILGARATKAIVHRLAQLVTHTINFTRCSPGFQARNPNIHEQVTSIVDPLFSDGAAQWPYTKAMVMESPWHFAHRFAATDPVALWGSKRAKLTGDDKRLPYIDAATDEQADRWWRVAPTLPGFARVCPPILNILAATVEDPVEHDGRVWEFRCAILNRATGAVYDRWLPLMVLKYGNPEALRAFCKRKAMSVPDAPVYNHALHGNAIFGADADEDVM